LAGLYDSQNLAEDGHLGEWTADLVLDLDDFWSLDAGEQVDQSSEALAIDDAVAVEAAVVGDRVEEAEAEDLVVDGDGVIAPAVVVRGAREQVVAGELDGHTGERTINANSKVLGLELALGASEVGDDAALYNTSVGSTADYASLVDESALHVRWQDLLLLSAAFVQAPSSIAETAISQTVATITKSITQSVSIAAIAESITAIAPATPAPGLR